MRRRRILDIHTYPPQPHLGEPFPRATVEMLRDQRPPCLLTARALSMRAKDAESLSSGRGGIAESERCATTCHRESTTSSSKESGPVICAVLAGAALLMQGDRQQRSIYRFDEERNCWQRAAAVRSYTYACATLLLPLRQLVSLGSAVRAQKEPSSRASSNLKALLGTARCASLVSCSESG